MENYETIKIAASQVVTFDPYSLKKGIRSAYWKHTGDGVIAKILGHHFYLINGLYTNGEVRLFLDGHRAYGVRYHGRNYRNRLINAICKASNFKL